MKLTTMPLASLTMGAIALVAITATTGNAETPLAMQKRHCQ